jgi:AraC-like DNA-binding protein
MSRLDVIDDWIEKARTARYNAARLAALCWVTDRHLRRHFQDTPGQSPQRWLREVQLLHSILQLLAGYRIGAVSSDFHFSSPSHFSASFRACFGTIPSAFPCDQCAIRALIARLREQPSVNANGPAGSLPRLRASVLAGLNERASPQNRAGRMSGI